MVTSRGREPALPCNPKVRPAFTLTDPSSYLDRQLYTPLDLSYLVFLLVVILLSLPLPCSHSCNPAPDQNANPDPNDPEPDPNSQPTYFVYVFNQTN